MIELVKILSTLPRHSREVLWFSSGEQVCIGAITAMG